MCPQHYTPTLQELPPCHFMDEKSETSESVVPRLSDFMGKLKEKSPCTGSQWDQAKDRQLNSVKG